MNRRVLVTALLGSFLVLLAWYFLLWSPRNNDLEEARERRETAEASNRDLQAAVQRLRSAQTDEPRLRARLERLRSAVPDQPNLGQFILDVNDAAVRAGIDFISIAPTPPATATATATTPAAGLTTTTTTTPAEGTTATTTAPTAATRAPAEIRLSLQINGGYFQVIDFLNRLADLPRIVVIDGLNITADPAGRLTSTVTARTFVQPSALQPTAATTTTTTTVAGGAGATTTTTAAGGAGATTTTTGARP